MISPLDEILAWVKNLAPAQQMDVVFLVSAMPGLNVDPSTDTMTSVFLDQIEELRSGKVREQALILCLRTLIENFIISRRSDPEGWKKTKAILESLSAENNNPTFAEMAERKQFEGAQWVSSCKKWNEMAKIHLTDENIERWFNLG